MALLEKIKALYKGDIIAGSFYIGIGVGALIAGLLLYFLAPTLGYYYLSIGLLILAAYMIGKGLVMMYLYYSRFKFYQGVKGLSRDILKDEKSYTEYRSNKKNRNRRRYLWIIAIGMMVAFYGIFDQEKGLIIATCIPIVLIAGIEFGVGLLTEFRLFELLRQIEKEA